MEPPGAQQLPRPSCRTFRLHQYIANKGALYVFLSLKLCIGFFSLQLLRGQALVKGTRKHSNPRLGGHAGLPGREFAMHRDWALASTLVGGSIRALRRPISVWNGNDQRAVASAPIICSGKVFGIRPHLEESIVQYVSHHHISTYKVLCGSLLF